MKSRSIIIMVLAGAMAFTGIGCTRHTIAVEPIKIEPIYMTIDVNVRVDRELDEFFDYKQAPATDSEGMTGTESPQVNPEGGSQ